MNAVRVDDLARVHLPVGVPDRLELAEGRDELVAEHLRQELRPRLAVAVLARERAAELEDEVGRLVEEAAEGLDPLRRLEVEVPAGVDAALAVVAVERALVAVTARRASPRSRRYSPEPLGRDGRVLPALVGVGLARAGTPSRRGPPRALPRCAARRAGRRRASSRDGPACPSFSRSRISARAFSSASSFVSPPNSTSSQPPALGQQRAGRARACRASSCPRSACRRSPSRPSRLVLAGRP